MSNIVIHFRDGTKEEFRHQGRAGGSYTKRLIYEGNFVIVEDEYYRRTAFPAELVAKIEESPER